VFDPVLSFNMHIYRSVVNIILGFAFISVPYTALLVYSVA